MNAERIVRLVGQFNGLIKYAPMLQDHPEWTDEQCVDFARMNHRRALAQREADRGQWNSGIAYCRNIWREDLA